MTTLPYVDGKRVFLSGHSVGAVLTCLTAMMPSPYQAAAALDGSVDMHLWATFSPANELPYDRNNAEEVHVRDPMAFVSSLRIPLKLYAGKDTKPLNEKLAAKAKQMGVDCELIVVPGDHQAMVAPAVELAIVWFRQKVPG